MRLRSLACLAAIGTLLFNAGNAAAQVRPAKPMRIITSEAGGAGDFVSRVVADGLIQSSDKQVIVDNRATTGPDLSAKASPDGNTLFASGPALWIAPILQKVSWDPIKDFTPVIIVARAPGVLVVHPSVAATSVKELIAVAKAKPGELNYGSSGVGTQTHLSGELFKMMAGVNLVRINYKGVAAAVTDTIGGRIQLMFPSAAAAAPHVKAGKLRALAITTAEPSVLFPGLATVASSGLPGYEAVASMAIFAPAKTPKAVVNGIARDITALLDKPEIKERFFNNGMETVGGSPQQCEDTVKAEINKWGKVAQQAGMRAE